MSANDNYPVRLSPEMEGFLSYVLEDICENVRLGNLEVTYGLNPTLYWAWDTWIQLPTDMRMSFSGAENILEDDEPDYEAAVERSAAFVDEFTDLLLRFGQEYLIAIVLDKAAELK